MPRPRRARHAADQGDRRRQAHLLREADRDQSRRGDCGAEARRRQGRQDGTVQDKLFLPGVQSSPSCATPASSAACCRCAASSDIGCSRAAGRRRSGHRGTIAARMAAASFSTWSATGATCSTTCSAKSKSVSCLGTTDIPERFDEKGKQYTATADDSAYATFRLEGGVIAHINMSWVTRVYRDNLVTFQVDSTHGSAVAGLTDCVIQPRQATPRPVWNPTKSVPMISMPIGRRFRTTSSTTTASRSSGKCSSATSARMRPTSSRCSKAPRACSWPNAR